MKKILYGFVILLLWAGMGMASTIGDAVEVSVVTDNGHTVPFYPSKMSHHLKKVYAEAVQGDHYRIIVRNKLNRRIGVVIAVDGRNIISGRKSWLKPSERMYIIDPHATNEFSGWRSGQSTIHRFYFTDVPDSYAASFGDESAMGIIALAVFPEIQPHNAPMKKFFFSPRGGMKEPAMDSAAPSAAEKGQALESAGTGFGREEYSPSYSVSFHPESKAVESILIKYEWRKTLCQLNIIDCCRACNYSHNRMWENDGFAPPPPRLR